MEDMLSVYWCLFAKLLPVPGSETILVTLVLLFCVVHSRVAVKPLFQSKCKDSSCRTNEQSGGNVYSWDEETVFICPVCVSESSPVGNQSLGRQHDFIPIRNEHLTPTKTKTKQNFNTPVKHITVLEPVSTFYFNNMHLPTLKSLFHYRRKSSGVRERD